MGVVWLVDATIILAIYDIIDIFSFKKDKITFVPSKLYCKITNILLICRLSIQANHCGKSKVFNDQCF